jgi:RNA polymerase sigma-54 factor
MLELKQTQKLSPVLTQQLQQAIKLLQLSKLELTEAIEQEIKENPILEVIEESPEGPAQESPQESPQESSPDEKEDTQDIADWLDRFSPSEEYTPRDNRELPDYENTVRKTYNLRDHLRWQIGLSEFNSDERLVAEWIVENIDDNGYLVCSIEEISKDSGFLSQPLEDVLKKIQKLEPSGVGARDLKECILLQYEASDEKDEIFEQIVSSYFNYFQNNNLKAIVKATGYTLDQVKEVLEKFKHFDPKPGRNFADEYTSYIVPDVYVVKTEDGFDIFLNDDGIPELRLNRYYINLYADKKVNGDARKYIKDKVRQAEWFIKSIEQRQRTLYLVAKSIVQFQGDFFEKGLRFLKPLILKDVALDIGVHESTVSRITTNKYMNSPQGIYELKFFFPTSINKTEGEALSTNVVMDMISELVKKEDKSHPLTDDELASLLKEKNSIKIARRTIAKYRDILHIRSSRERTVLD